MGTLNHPWASGTGRGLPGELEATRVQIVEIARGYGLDFFDTIFLMCSYKEINMLASYGGFPNRYPHWRFGMEYLQMSRGYEYGLQKIYEMVINTDPSFAYLLDNNEMVDQKLVIAHVLGHVDFFKHNAWFSQTNRKMLDQMANHATRIRRHINRHGTDEVEQWIDTCLSLDNLIDPYLPHIRRERLRTPEELEDIALGEGVFKLPARNYMDSYVNPPEFIAEQKARRLKERETIARFPEEPQRDVLLFLLRHADLPQWKADVLHIIREEAYYFAPQAQTKIMNEGWATYWHTKMMTEDILDSSEIIDYCDHHSGTVASRPGNLNPYKLGVELYRHIEHRWDKGQFGKAWMDCEDATERRCWDTAAGLGREKVFEVRRVHNDVTFVDSFLTEDFVRAHGIFSWEFDKRTREYVISSRDFYTVKAKILSMLSNHGQPRILVSDGNHANRGELVLTHTHDGVDLQVKWAESTLQNLFGVWGRTVRLETTLEEKPVVLVHDGSEFSKEERDG